LVTPKNRWSPYRILLNTVIRYNRANEKVSHVVCMRLPFSLPCHQQNRKPVSSFISQRHTAAAAVTIAAAKPLICFVARQKLKPSLHKLYNCSLLERLR